jgi:non-ribosomal peptide synthetase component F
MAHYLRFLGVGAECPVPIYMKRSPEFIVTLLAILKAGGVCMPMDTKYPLSRVQFMIEQAEPKVGICFVLYHTRILYLIQLCCRWW